MRLLMLMLFLIMFSIPVHAGLPLGTLTPMTGSDPNCPAGFACRAFQVSCAMTPNVSGFYSYRVAPNPIGVVIFFSGLGGTSWWSGANQFLPAMVNDLISAGYSVIQVRWKTGWLESASGVDSGLSKLACRPATVINYLYKTFQPATNYLVITGNSGGSSQVSYSLAYYSLDGIVDVLIPTSGPPHSALQKSCLRNAGESGYWFDISQRRLTDKAFGFFNANGPCYLQKSTFFSRWTSESVGYGGDDYTYPFTKVRMILGGDDALQETITQDYIQRLNNAGTPVDLQILPGVGHEITETSSGRTALLDAITRR
jgi:hypothetical protein